MLILRVGDTEAAVDPRLGASLQRFTVGGADVLRRGRPDLGSSLHMASFAMVPWCNRITEGVFTWDGKLVDVGPSPEVEEVHGLHGHGWRWRWDVADSTPTGATLEYLHPAGRWPWRYRTVQAIEIDEGRLVCKISIENLSDTPMPFSLGFHPWFERPARLSANVDGMWTGEDVIPERWREADPFRGFDVDRDTFDNTFTGWDGRATIEAGDLRIQLTSDLDRLHVFTPAGHGHFAVEPAGAPPAALNHPDREPPVLLQPGASADRYMRLTAT